MSSSRYILTETEDKQSTQSQCSTKQAYAMENYGCATKQQELTRSYGSCRMWSWAFIHNAFFGMLYIWVPMSLLLELHEKRCLRRGVSSICNCCSALKFNGRCFDVTFSLFLLALMLVFLFYDCIYFFFFLFLHLLLLASSRAFPGPSQFGNSIEE